MAEPYDPARDLATLLHAARRQGFWQPAARGAITRLESELGIEDKDLASDIERSLRYAWTQAAARQAALDNVRYLAELPPDLLGEAMMRWQDEHPDQAARLAQLLSGEAGPRHLEEAEQTS